MERKEELMERYREAVSEVRKWKDAEKEALEGLKEYSGHKEGEIAIFKRKSFKWSDGWGSAMVVNKEWDEKVVVSKVVPFIGSRGDVEYAYHFRKVKKDGSLSEKRAYQNESEIVWTGEAYSY